MSGLVYEGVPQEVFFALPFDGHTPQGNVAFHEGFKADGQQGAGTLNSASDPRRRSIKKKIVGQQKQGCFSWMVQIDPVFVLAPSLVCRMAYLAAPYVATQYGTQ